MFNPDPESDVVKRLKDSLKIPDEEPEPEAAGAEDSAAEDSRKRRHGVGFGGRERVKRSVDQVKLLSRLSGDSRKKTLKAPRAPQKDVKPKQEQETGEESRLGLIFKDMNRKRG